MNPSEPKQPPKPVRDADDEDDVVECSSPPCSIGAFADDYFGTRAPAPDDRAPPCRPRRRRRR